MNHKTRVKKAKEKRNKKENQMAYKQFSIRFDSNPQTKAWYKDSADDKWSMHEMFR